MRRRPTGAPHRPPPRTASPPRRAIIDWSSAAQASSFRGFVDSVPAGRFVVVDMSVDGSGEWQKWGNASFFGAPYVWTTLHDFG